MKDRWRSRFVVYQYTPERGGKGGGERGRESESKRAREIYIICMRKAMKERWCSRFVVYRCTRERQRRMGGRERERERDRDRDRETERETDRQTETDRETDRDRQRELICTCVVCLLSTYQVWVTLFNTVKTTFHPNHSVFFHV